MLNQEAYRFWQYEDLLSSLGVYKNFYEIKHFFFIYGILAYVFRKHSFFRILKKKEDI